MWSSPEGVSPVSRRPTGSPPAVRRSGITLLESDHRLGGNIHTERIGGRLLDVGAEALLARVPAGVAMWPPSASGTSWSLR